MSVPPRGDLLRSAHATLKKNDLGEWTRPAPGLYPHQWFWDSCFIAIGLRHIDPARAQQELRCLVRGQWHNGMIPHIRFSAAPGYHAGPELWQIHCHPAAPENVSTTAITQPPMLAEAVVRVADVLSGQARRAWLAEMLPPIIRLHDWLYRERDPYDEGLVFLMHAWEAGLDNTPPWMDVIRDSRPGMVRLADTFRLESWLTRRRKDTRQVPAEERIGTLELYTLYDILGRLRGCGYDAERILGSSVPLVIDVVFNAILVRANTHLLAIAEEIGADIPARLQASIAKSAVAFRTLSKQGDEYFPRDFRTRRLIEQPSVATFLPLYSGAVSPEEAERLVRRMRDPRTYWLPHVLPSAPRNSSYFRPRCYWQGPVWVNMNWLVIDGLRRYGHGGLAEELRRRTLEMVRRGGMSEYFSPLDGAGAGSAPFSWTAALTIDLLAEEGNGVKPDAM